jgi:hypothetical protein
MVKSTILPVNTRECAAMEDEQDDAHFWDPPRPW